MLSDLMLRQLARKENAVVERSRDDEFADALMHFEAALAQFNVEDQPAIYIDPARFPTPFSRKRVVAEVAADWGQEALKARVLKARDREELPFARCAELARRFQEMGTFSSFDFDGEEGNEMARALSHQEYDAPFVVFDSARFPNRSSRIEILKETAIAHADHLFTVRELEAADLEHLSVGRSKHADKSFLRRGYVSSFECRGLRQGDNAPESTYLARNRAATCLQLTIVATSFDVYGASEKRFRAPALKRPQTERDSFERMEKTLGALCGDAYRTRLIRRDGLFLPKTFPRRGDAMDRVFVPAYAPKLQHAMELGAADPFRILPAVPREIAKQTRFEYESTTDLFGGASKEAVLLWQTQVLAYLRMSAWAIEMENSSFFDRTICESKRYLAKREYLETWRQYRREDTERCSVSSLRPPRERAREDYCDELIEGLREAEINVTGATSDPRLSIEQIFIATLHGGTYAPLTATRAPSEEQIRYGLCEDPLRVLNPIAAWIGDLKRRRYAILDASIAERFRELASDEDDGGLRAYLPLVEDRLGPSVWSELASACHDLLDGQNSAAIEVAYVWTQDPKKAWSARRINRCEIEITGTLLDFPAREAERWRKDAAALWRPNTQSFEFV